MLGLALVPHHFPAFSHFPWLKCKGQCSICGVVVVQTEMVWLVLLKHGPPCLRACLVRVYHDILCTSLHKQLGFFLATHVVHNASKEWVFWGGFATNPHPNGFSMLLWDVPCGSGLENVDIKAMDHHERPTNISYANALMIFDVICTVFANFRGNG